MRVAQVAKDQGAGRRVYDPSHPDADGQGFVTADWIEMNGSL